MTCIVGLVHKGKVWIGGDSAGVDAHGLGLVQRADRKVFRSGPFIFGFTHSFRMGQLIRYCFKPPVPGESDDLMGFMVGTFIDGLRACLTDGGLAKIEHNVEEGGTFLVGHGGRLFVIHEDYQVGESVHGFDAVGCGEQIACGAMFVSSNITDPRKRVRQALEAAECFSGGVRAPFHIMGL